MSNSLLQDKKLKVLGELKLVGFRVLCSGDQYASEIHKASLHLQRRTSEIKSIKEINQQVGAFVVEESSQDEDGYWITMEVENFNDIPSDMVCLTIPPQTYATARFKGSNEHIPNAYNELHKWMEIHNRRRLLDSWHLEIFHSWEDVDNIDVDLFDTIKK